MSTPQIPPHLQGAPATQPAVGSRRAAAAASANTHSVADRIRTGVRGVGEVLITLGVVLLLFCAYQLYWTDFTSSRDTAKELAQIEQVFDATPLPPKGGEILPLGELEDGETFGRMYVPRFGDSWVKPLIQGVNMDDLHKGIGHYKDTALPGEIGNFSVAGHRTTNGHPFRNMDQLKPGDQVFVETKYAWYTYEVTVSELIVTPKQTYVIQPVPEIDWDGSAPTERLLTMTTCHPPYSAAERMIAHGVLTDTRSRADGPPPGVPGAAV
jgi:sortase A